MILLVVQFSSLEAAEPPDLADVIDLLNDGEAPDISVTRQVFGGTDAVLKDLGTKALPQLETTRKREILIQILEVDEAWVPAILAGNPSIVENSASTGSIAIPFGGATAFLDHPNLCEAVEKGLVEQGLEPPDLLRKSDRHTRQDLIRQLAKAYGHLDLTDQRASRSSTQNSAVTVTPSTSVPLAATETPNPGTDTNASLETARLYWFALAGGITIFIFFAVIRRLVSKGRMNKKGAGIDS